MLATVPGAVPAGGGFDIWPERRWRHHAGGTPKGVALRGVGAQLLTDHMGARAAVDLLGALGTEVEVTLLADDPTGMGVPQLDAEGEVPTAQLPAELAASLNTVYLLVT